MIAWILGWDLILEYALGAATVASGWSGYVLSFRQDFGIHLPPRLAGAPGTVFVEYPVGSGHWERLSAQFHKVLGAANIDPFHPRCTRNSSFNLFGFLGILFVTVVLIIGIKESANFNSVIVIVKVAILMVFIGLSTEYVFGHRAEAAANWHPVSSEEHRRVWKPLDGPESPRPRA